MTENDLVSKAMSEMAAEKLAAGKKAPDLVAEKLVKAYGDRTVVNGMDVACSCGEIVGLLGPNGAGKTTTFYMVVGLVKPDGGRVTFRGEDITRDPVYVRARKGLDKKARQARAEELLTPFDLMKVARQPAYTLSGGERRKLEIARALVRNPAILMLDEPFAGVDPLSVNEIQDIVRRLAKQGLGIIITDHNVRETLSVVDRAYMVYNGRLLKEGTTAELVNDEEVRARYLGEAFHM